MRNTMSYEEANNICTELMQFCKDEAYEYREEAHDDPEDYDNCMENAKKASKREEALRIVLERC